MSADHSSLISFLAAPVLVVDPEGHIIYANPAFEKHFCGRESRPLQGEDLALIFEGGGREAILRAVAQVCDSGVEVRFKLREAERGYLAVASPIESDERRIGVMILFTDDQQAHDRLLTFHSQIQEPLDAATSAMEELFEQTGGRRAEVYRTLVERSLSALDRVRKWSDELQHVLTGRRDEPADETDTFDPVKTIRGMVGSLGAEFDQAGVQLDLLMPAQLPKARGAAALVESALMRMLRGRLSDAASGSRVTLCARTMGAESNRALVISVVDDMPAAMCDSTDGWRMHSEPRALGEALLALGGQAHTTVEPVAGRVTSLRLLLAD